MLRLDMSEFGERHTASRRSGRLRVTSLREAGQLTEQVRRHPYSVILLARSRRPTRMFFNVLLQVSTTDGSPTARAARWTSRTPS